VHDGRDEREPQRSHGMLDHPVLLNTN
jgi:hypothetical protein